ncbi:MAG: hypothetical protein WCT12_25485 [Verrucomicrobiota bacterium]
MTPNEIVVVCQVFYPDSQSTSQLLTDLLRGMSGGGLQITVITGYTAKQDGVFPPRRDRLGAGIAIRRAGVAIDYKRSLVRRGLHYLCYLAGSTIELWKLRKSSFVFGVTNPPFAPIWLWLLSKFFVRRYQIMLQDIYPEGLVGVGRMKPHGMLTRFYYGFVYLGPA